MTNESENPGKIIVDDDWKSKVQAEKARAAAPPAEAPAAADKSKLPPLPPASFGTLLSMLASQALVALGHLADPVSGKPEVRLDVAKHYIDTLSMLAQKTAGNLTADESRILTGLLHDLRMGYIQVRG